MITGMLMILFHLLPYPCIRISVDRGLYLKVGFTIVGENDEEYIMVCGL